MWVLYDEEEALKQYYIALRREYYDIGFKIGYKEGCEEVTIRTLSSLIDQGLITVSQAAEYMKISVEEFDMKVKKLKA